MDKTDIQKMHDNLAFIKCVTEVYGKEVTRAWIQNAAYIVQYYGCKCLSHLKFHRRPSSMYSEEIACAIDQAIGSKLIFDGEVDRRHEDYDLLKLSDQENVVSILNSLIDLDTYDMQLLAITISVAKANQISYENALESLCQMKILEITSKAYWKIILEHIYTLDKSRHRKTTRAEDYGRTRALEVQYDPELNISSNLEELVGRSADSEIVNNEYTRLCWIFDETETKDLKIALALLEQSQFPIEIAVLKVVVKLEYFNKKDI